MTDIFGDTYCLDTNVFIKAWTGYYSPEVCPDYWEILITLGKQGKIFVPQLVYEEISKVEDDLYKWLKNSKMPIRKIDEPVTKCLQAIYSKDPKHQFLVDNTKSRSLADPWVIAHAMSEQAVVVTKEEKVTAATSKRIKIPNVCENMDVRWINDFQFIKELNIKFSCKLH